MPVMNAAPQQYSNISLMMWAMTASSRLELDRSVTAKVLKIG
jgi:hypothetical protein